MRSSMREVRVGLIVLGGLAGLAGLVTMAGGGPGFLAARRAIDVVFRDGQGLRVGAPVRVAGIDAGRVAAIDLAEVEGTLRARVRLNLPADLVERLRQDVKVTIKTGLTGQAVVDVVSSGRSSVALVPGQVIAGVESSFFDPILEQVGLGPVERSHLSHTIAEVRTTVDAIGPRLRQTLATLQESAAGLRETVAAVKPKVEATAGHIEGMAQRVAASKIDEAIAHLESIVARTDAILGEGRPKMVAALGHIEQLSAAARDLAVQEKPKLSALLDGLTVTRARADRAMVNLEVMTGQGASILTQNRAEIDRVLANVRDASEYGVKLVQKLYGNPFYLSPFYKPKPEDIRAQEMYDAALTFSQGAKEFRDALKTLQAMQGRARSKDEVAAYNKLFLRAWEVSGKLNESSRGLAEGVKSHPNRR